MSTLRTSNRTRRREPREQSDKKASTAPSRRVTAITSSRASPSSPPGPHRPSRVHFLERPLKLASNALSPLRFCFRFRFRQHTGPGEIFHRANKLLSLKEPPRLASTVQLLSPHDCVCLPVRGCIKVSNSCFFPLSHCASFPLNPQSLPLSATECEWPLPRPARSVFHVGRCCNLLCLLCLLRRLMAWRPRHHHRLGVPWSSLSCQHC